MYRSYFQFHYSRILSFFSRATLNLSTMIPAMDHIDTHLATASQNMKYSLAIRASLALGNDINHILILTDTIFWHKHPLLG